MPRSRDWNTSSPKDADLDAAVVHSHVGPPPQPGRTRAPLLASKTWRARGRPRRPSAEIEKRCGWNPMSRVAQVQRYATMPSRRFCSTGVSRIMTASMPMPIWVK